MKQSILRLLALISFVVAASVVSLAQSSAAGSISGVVKDPNGAVVVGASVTVKNPGNGQEFSATSSDNGTFTIPAVPSGTYTVTIKAQGFKTAVVKNVEVLAATPASGSRTTPLAKLDAALFGLPGRTVTVGSRRQRPSTKPLRVMS